MTHRNQKSLRVIMQLERIVRRVLRRGIDVTKSLDRIIADLLGTHYRPELKLDRKSRDRLSIIAAEKLYGQLPKDFLKMVSALSHYFLMKMAAPHMLFIMMMSKSLIPKPMMKPA